ncbi:hypothetical protein DMH26_44760 [Streptomyces sp. WAC 05379]|nr:hypothetical protein DMH26_44760 [Streptomyces sp. WAC 05379]
MGLVAGAVGLAGGLRSRSTVSCSDDRSSSEADVEGEDGDEDDADDAADVAGTADVAETDEVPTGTPPGPSAAYARSPPRSPIASRPPATRTSCSARRPAAMRRTRTAAPGRLAGQVKTGWSLHAAERSTRDERRVDWTRYGRAARQRTA